jgi:hypothetical protein
MRMTENKMSAVFNAMLAHMVERSSRRVASFSRAYFTDERLEMFDAATARKGSVLPHVWGFLDGTVFQLCRPSGRYAFQRSIYSGHKKVR